MSWQIAREATIVLNREGVFAARAYLLNQGVKAKAANEYLLVKMRCRTKRRRTR